MSEAEDYENSRSFEQGKTDAPKRPRTPNDEELPGMLAVAKGVAEQTWPHTMDAAVWASEFMKHNPNAFRAEIDEGLMLTWFANAIMAGYDTAQSRAAPSETNATGPRATITPVSNAAGTTTNAGTNGDSRYPNSPVRREGEIPAPATYPLPDKPHPQEVINYLNECVEAQCDAWPLTKVAISKRVVDDIVALLSAPSARKPIAWLVAVEESGGWMRVYGPQYISKMAAERDAELPRARGQKAEVWECYPMASTDGKDHG